jgi:lipocalin
VGAGFEGGPESGGKAFKTDNQKQTCLKVQFYPNFYQNT